MTGESAIRRSGLPYFNLPPFGQILMKQLCRDGGPQALQGERVHLRAVAGGWQVRKCHFRGLKHLRAVKISPLTRVPNGELSEARLDVGLLDRTSLPLVMPALLIGKGRENHCVQLPREEVHPRAMTGENTISVGKSPCLR